MKKLYLVKMGMDYKNEGEMKGSDVGNYRIRGTFHNKKGELIFIEFGRGYERKGKKTLSTIKLHIDHQFNASKDWDENKSHITINYETLKDYNYTKKDILKYIHKKFGVKFDELELIDTCLCDYDYKKIGGDEFTPNYEEIAQAQKIKDYFYDYEKNVERKKYPNFSIYYDNEKLNVLLHYNCYNDLVIIDDLMNYDFNYKKPIEKIEKAQNKYYGGIK